MSDSQSEHQMNQVAGASSIPMGIEAAIIGPLLYAPDTDLARNNPKRVAIHAPNNYGEAMQQIFDCRECGATSVHIHPIEEGTGIHRKTPELYARNALGARVVAPGVIINNDASLNGVGLSTSASEIEYLKTRLAGLMNDDPPDVFTLFATNEALMVADTPGGFPRCYVEDFIRIAGRELEKKRITALAEISQDPYGMRSVRRGLEILENAGIGLPALSFSFLVNGTAMLPAFAGKPLAHQSANGDMVMETPKERFMRVVNEAVRIKEEFNLKGPLTFGTVVTRRKDEQGRGVLQHEVWDWVAEWAQNHPQAARDFGIIVKAGLEEWSHYDGRQVSNPEAVCLARDYMDQCKTPDGKKLFDMKTDTDTMRGWVFG